jgi:hypothetical protein
MSSSLRLKIQRLRQEPGLVVVDNSSIRQLESAERRAVLSSNMRAAGWRAQASVINVLEVLKHRSPGGRKKRLGVVRWLAGRGGLLPAPEILFRRVGEAIQRGDPAFDVPWVTAPSRFFDGAITDEEARLAEKWLSDDQMFFDRIHDRARVPIREGMRELGVRGDEYDAATFLDAIWRSERHIDSYLQNWWRDLGLSGSAPVDRLRESEVWMLYLDIHGIVAYEQTFLARGMKKVHAPDLLQLLYLGINPLIKRAIVSEDTSFLRAASSVLQGRYPRAEAVPLSAFLR